MEFLTKNEAIMEKMNFIIKFIRDKETIKFFILLTLMIGTIFIFFSILTATSMQKYDDSEDNNSDEIPEKSENSFHLYFIIGFILNLFSFYLLGIGFLLAGVISIFSSNKSFGNSDKKSSLNYFIFGLLLLLISYYLYYNFIKY